MLTMIKIVPLYYIKKHQKERKKHMYTTIPKELKKYIKKTEDGISHTKDMPKELDEMFEETERKFKIHDEMRDLWKEKI